MAMLRKIALFYYEGFRSMTVGRTLWAIILIKLTIMFLVLRLIFFPATLGGLNDQEKADFVTHELTQRKAQN